MDVFVEGKIKPDVIAFLTEYNALTKKYNMHITSCGTCGEMYLEEEPADLLIAQHGCMGLDHHLEY